MMTSALVLSPLEDAVLGKLLSGKSQWLGVLRAQVPLLRVRTRELTGAGFLTRFSIDEEAPRIVDHPSFKFGDVSAHIDGLQYGAGFLLSVTNGHLDTLEGYSYEEPWPNVIKGFQIYYSNNKITRDEHELESSVIYSPKSARL